MTHIGKEEAQISCDIENIHYILTEPLWFPRNVSEQHLTWQIIAKLKGQLQQAQLKLIPGDNSILTISSYYYYNYSDFRFIIIIIKRFKLIQRRGGIKMSHFKNFRISGCGVIFIHGLADTQVVCLKVNAVLFSSDFERLPQNFFMQ